MIYFIESEACVVFDRDIMEIYLFGENLMQILLLWIVVVVDYC